VKTEPLLRTLEVLEQEHRGEISAALRHLPSGDSLEWNAALRLPSASVIKVPILVELFAQAEAGRLRLEDRVCLEEAARTEGSGVLSMLHTGLACTLLDLAHLMIVVSDNAASNLLIEQVTCDAVNERLAGLGYTRTRLGRKFYDFEARDRGLDNWAAADEFADLFTRLERRELVSATASEQMLQILKRQQFSDRIPGLLPADVIVAHKTGSITGICHDAGIVHTPSGPLVLAIFTRGFAEPGAAPHCIRTVARAAYSLWGLPDPGGGGNPA